MIIAPYDFRSPKPLTAELGRRLDAWFAEAVRRAGKSWGHSLTAPPELRRKVNRVVRYDDCLAYAVEENLCYRVTRDGGGPASLLCVPRNLMLVLLDAALGETVNALPEDRALTSVEEALAAYLVRVLFLDEFRSAWPGPGALELTSGPRESDPRANLPFTPGDGALACSFSVAGAFGKVDWTWLLPRVGWIENSSVGAKPVDADGKGTAVPLEKLARRMPVELVVLLGSAEVALAQVERLQVGDLILLEQDVNQPLEARICGETKFLVFPGAAGSRRAVRIQSRVPV